MLPDLNLPSVLNTSDADIIADFFVPVLGASEHYDRGVGFFSAGWLRVAAKGMVAFAQNSGRARWVTSPILSQDVWQALQIGEIARHDALLRQALETNVTELERQLEQDTLNALAWLVADGILTFKLALPRNKLDQGDFHDKFGIFQDAMGNRISFNGSYNDSVQGTRNYESIKVFCSWQEVFAPFVEYDANRFNLLWSNADPNVQVFSLPDAARERIVRLRMSNARPYGTPDWAKLKKLDSEDSLWTITLPPRPGIPPHITLRDYQAQAISNWFDAGCRGLFEMATGTGKTITALALTTRLHAQNQRLALIITVPYQHLVDQWYDEARDFGYVPLRAYKGRESWLDELNNRIISYNHGDIDVVCVIATHTSFSTAHFQKTIGRIADNALLIADEAHHLGAETRRLHYPENAKLRLALSATPDRWFDDEGTAALRAYFGPTVFELSLADAIGISLTHYYYYPHLVELTPEEIEEYKILSVRIGRLLAFDEVDNDQLTRLLLKRANLLNSAKNKIGAISELVDKQSTMKHTLFYCSPGQIDEVVHLLGWQKRFQVHRFTAREDIPTRQRLLSDFGRGELDALVAMHCLDEGVDVPSTRTAYILASSSNPRQFIQRRGRVLRKAPGKDHAVIFDLITVPPPPSELEENGMQAERSILRRELRRFAEFADSALNTQAAYETIWDLAKQFNVLDF